MAMHKFVIEWELPGDIDPYEFEAWIDAKLDMGDFAELVCDSVGVFNVFYLGQLDDVGPYAGKVQQDIKHLFEKVEGGEK